MDFSKQPSGGFKYIMNVKDWFTKYVILIPLPSKDGESKLTYHTVYNLLCVITGKQLCSELERTLNFCGPLVQEVHTDNGKEFRNQHVVKLLKARNIREIHGAPYKPTTQGLVEQSNCTVKERLNAWMEDQRKKNKKKSVQWHLGLQEVASKTCSHVQAVMLVVLR